MAPLLLTWCKLQQSDAHVIMRAVQGNLAASHKLISTNIGKPYTYSGLMPMLYRAIKAANKTRERKGIETKIESFGFSDLKGKDATDMLKSGVPIE